MTLVGLVLAFVVFIALIVYWALDYATYPYRKLLRCTEPPLNASYTDPTTNLTRPFWINGSTPTATP